MTGKLAMPNLSHARNSGDCENNTPRFSRRVPTHHAVPRIPQDTVGTDNGRGMPRIEPTSGLPPKGIHRHHGDVVEAGGPTANTCRCQGNVTAPDPTF